MLCETRHGVLQARKQRVHAGVEVPPDAPPPAGRGVLDVTADHGARQARERSPLDFLPILPPS